MIEYPYKKQEMEKFYRSGDNPWGYVDKHSEVYRYVFDKIEAELPEHLFVLELGCGEGYYAKVLLDYFKTRIAYYMGVDISATACEIAAKRLKNYQNIILLIEDFELGDQWIEYVEDANFVIANESLYYCNRPKTVIAKLNEHMVPNSYFLVTDSIVRYTTRESPHREFDFELIKKVVHNSHFINGQRWSHKAFLTKKIDKKVDKKGGKK